MGEGSWVPYPVGQLIAFDVEADGLKIHKGNRIICWSYLTEKGEFGFMRKSPENLKWLKRLFSDPTKTIIMHNGKFELTALMAEGFDVFAMMETGARCEDTMLMSKVINSTEQEHGLQFCGKRYVGRDTTDKSEIDEWLKKHNTKALIRARGRELNYSDVPDDILKRRNLWDVATTLMLYHFFRRRIAATCQQLYETERELMYVCVDMETHGVRVDITRARELKAQALKDMAKIADDLNDLILPIDVPRKKKGVVVIETIDRVFNPNSVAHLIAAFQKLNIELKYKTKPKKNKKKGGYTGGGKWSFDEYAMLRYVPRQLASMIRDSGEENWSAEKFYDAVHSLIQEHDLDPKWMLPPLVLKYRELSKMVSTYYNHIIEEAVDREWSPGGREFGIIHCHFNQSQAMTGRFSSSEPNLQNMPRLLGPRECYVPRKSRHNWHLDYSQVEMRMFAHFAQDEGMARAIDDDVHMYVAMKIYKKPRDQITKEQRKRSKGTGFGILYGSGAATQAETLTKQGLPTTKLEASLVVASYHRAFPSVRKLTNQLKVELIRNGYIVNPFGRRYYIPTKFAYRALNYLCQGTPADLIKAAMVKVWKWLRANGYGSKVKLIVQIHDELVIECPPSIAAEIMPKVMAMMEDRTSYFVPVTVEAEVVTTRWSEKKDPEKLGFKFAA